MLNDDLEKRKRGLEFATMLDELAADKAPDVYSEHAVHELAKLIRKRFTYSKELRKREILTHLKRATHTGGMSIAELIEETGYHKNAIYELTRELELEGRVELRSVSPAGAKGGRPALRYFLVLGFSVNKT